MIDWQDRQRSSAIRIAVVLDLRFPGGTSAAVAAELPELARIGTVEIYAITTRMFRNRDRNPVLNEAIVEAGLTVHHNPRVISADIVLFHNPSALRFDTALKPRIVCDTFVCVCHENFLLPNGDEAFDVGTCLDILDTALLCRARVLAPVSAYNRTTIADWSHAAGRPDNWAIATRSWMNICAFELQPPTDSPQDRRGRHSRPGFEKFPGPEAMDLAFPAHAQANHILGGDIFIQDDAPAHWTLYPFRSIPVERLLDAIDFFVYFTNPLWRESFGRVIAEAIAAGKPVLTDPATAANFGPNVLGLAVADVDACIRQHLDNPAKYQKLVHAQQADLAAYSGACFRRDATAILTEAGARP